MKLSRPLFTLTAWCLFTATSAQAESTINPKLKQNLTIMEDILQTSLKQDRQAGINRVSHSYLAGQGVLFRTETRGNFGHFFQMMPGLPPIPELSNITSRANNIAQAAVSAQASGGFMSDDEIEAIADQAAEEAERMMEQTEQLQDQMRDLRDQTRDLERDLRDIEREKRDIEFTRKVGKQDPEQQKQLNELTSKETGLKQQLAQLQQQSATFTKNMQAKQAEQQKLAAEKTATLISSISRNFAATLCDYGASLRELGNDEFVSLQLTTDHGRDSQDLYWVFKKSDIQQCVTGKLNASELLKKADYYQY